MKTNRIRLNESLLRSIIRKSVKRALKESEDDKKAWADYKIRNGIQDAHRSDLSYEDDVNYDAIDFGDGDRVGYPNYNGDDFSDDRSAPDFNSDYEIYNMDDDGEYDEDDNYIPNNNNIGNLDSADELDSYADSLNKSIKDRQMEKAYDDFGNRSQYPERYWGEGDLGGFDEYDNFPSYAKDYEVDQAWDEHNKNLNESIRRAIKKVLSEA